MSTDTTPPGFRAGLIGEWSEQPCEFEVSRDRIAAYAAATNDDIAKHSRGLVAPPVFAVVPAWPAMTRAVMEIVPPELTPRVVHGEQDMRLHRPIEPGMRLVSRGVARGVHARSSGVAVTSYAETRTRGELVVEQYMTTFVRGVQVAESLGEPAPGLASPPKLAGTPPATEVAQTYDADETYRYATASGDHTPIHFDQDGGPRGRFAGDRRSRAVCDGVHLAGDYRNRMPRGSDATQAAGGALHQYRAAGPRSQPVSGRPGRAAIARSTRMRRRRTPGPS